MCPSTVQRAVAAALLLAYVPGCTFWQVQKVPPAQLFADSPPSQVRVDRLDGLQLTLNNPRLAGDTIIGLLNADTMRVPLATVDGIAVREANGLKSAGLAVLVAGGLAVFFVVTSAIVKSEASRALED